MASQEGGAGSGANRLPCSCGGPARFNRRDERNVLGGAGHLAVARRHYACGHCRARQAPRDERAGVGGDRRVTPHAGRMIVLAGGRVSSGEAVRECRAGRTGAIRRLQYGGMWETHRGAERAA